jgi:hypothetical protein
MPPKTNKIIESNYSSAIKSLKWTLKTTIQMPLRFWKPKWTPKVITWVPPNQDKHQEQQFECH